MPTVQQGPSGRSDARHRVSASAVIRAPWGIQVAPFFMFRSALPIFTFEGVDLNRDSNNNDITAKAYQYDGEGVAPKEIGDCKTVNCSRGANFAQMNLRVSKSFALMGRTRIEAIGEVFNVFNALNPAFAQTSQRLANGVQRAAFMQPTAFAATSVSRNSASARSGSGSRSELAARARRGVRRALGGPKRIVHADGRQEGTPPAF